MGGLNDEQEGQGKREKSGGVGYKKKVAEATLESVGTTPVRDKIAISCM